MCYCLLCKIAQVALIQQAHAGGAYLSATHKDPQFPGQFSGGSPYPYCLCGSPEDQLSHINLSRHPGEADSYLCPQTHVLHRTAERLLLPPPIHPWTTGKKPHSSIFAHTCLQLPAITESPFSAMKQFIQVCQWELYTVTQAAAVKLLSLDEPIMSFPSWQTVHVLTSWTRISQENWNLKLSIQYKPHTYTHYRVTLPGLCKQK